MSLALQAAAVMAAEYHKEQKYGDHPYTKHLGDVVGVLKRFKIQDEDILVAGWLHDSLEDTTLPAFHIEVTFGRKVLDLVQRVTNEAGKNRKERHEKTYGKIQASDDAIILKLADRIANLEYSIESQDNGKIQMYTKEYEGFRAKLYKIGKHDVMWRHLDFLIGYSNDNK